MVRVILPNLLLTASLLAQTQPPAPKKTPPPNQQEQEPPEEDESLKPKVYALNPLESARNITAGDFYFKKGNFRAAARRYDEATKWDPGSADAFFKLAEADERLKDREGARAAYTKVLDLSPDGKDAGEAKKHLAKLPPPKK